MHDAPLLSYLPLFIFIAVIVGMAVAVLATAQQQHVLARIAHRFDGRVVPGSWLNYPEVRLRLRGYPAVLKYSPLVRNRYHTQFSITWPDDDLRCEIHPQGVFSGLRTLLGMADLQIGSPQFDAAFYISGKDPQAVRQLLSSEVQAVIFALQNIKSQSFFAENKIAIQVKWSGGALTVTKPVKLRDYESLERFISLSGALFVAALETRQAGIEFVGEVHEPDATESQCQVCGEPLADDLVHCQSCRTPHHRECWEYFGGCSTYACGAKRFVAPTKRRFR